jgi:prephenate dehydrogenase
MSSTPHIAILGYGRFGQALTALVLDAGRPLRVYDPATAVPEEVRADSAADAVRGAVVVVPAVPVDAFHAVLEQIRPALAPAHVVCDVTSVKRGAVESMQQLLGDDVPWVATHPLFGPASIARGERPLRVVVCPDTPHPAAAAAARELYTAIGCRVIDQDSAAHDRVMADTHALAFFVAKGMLAIGAGDDAEAVPPSFQAMATTINTVRSDAGHLFYPIQQGNPFAPDARERLLDALGRIHRELAEASQAEGGGAPAGEALAIPAAGPPPALGETRDAIDALDRRIVALLAQRAQLATRAARVKAAEGRAVQDPAREQALLERHGRRLRGDPALQPPRAARVAGTARRFRP